METNDNLEVGDVVRLKSGSPPMTVDYVNGDWARVVWIAQDGQIKTLETKRRAFRKVEPV